MKGTASLLMILLLCGCSTYKSNWSCKAPQGIGCSSLEYADQVARDQILLNQTKDAFEVELVE